MRTVRLKDIAEVCGVSTATVSRALNGQSSESSKVTAMICRTAREMGYVPNAAALTLKTSRSNNIGVLYENEMNHEYFSSLLDDLRREATARGYDLTLINNTTLTSSQQNPDSRLQESLDKTGWVSVLSADLLPIQQAWCDWAGAADTQQYLENHPYKVMLDKGTYAPAVRDGDLDKKWSQIQTAVKTWSWRAIYAENDGAFQGMVQQMIQQANSYGYADCVAWCEEQAALCWAAQQAQAAK